MTLVDLLIDAANRHARVVEVRVGPFFSVVRSSGCGLASTLFRGCGGRHAGGHPVGHAGDLASRPVQDLARLAFSDSPLEASIGMAAINSALPLDGLPLVERNASDIIEEHGAGRSVVILGDFPFIPQLRQVAGTLRVFDRDHPGPGVEPQDAMESALAEADVAAISGTVLLNRSLDRVLSLLRKDCYRVMLGPTTPLSRIVLDWGFDAVSGSLVVDPDRVLTDVSQGATFRQIRGIRRVTMTR